MWKISKSCLKGRHRRCKDEVNCACSHHRQIENDFFGMSAEPKLYETEAVPLEDKIIHRRYRIQNIGFYWLIAEIGHQCDDEPCQHESKEDNLAFGYANLNNDDFAEWGYISITELLENGAVLDRDWKPCTFKEAKERITAETVFRDCI